MNYVSTAARILTTFAGCPPIDASRYAIQTKGENDEQTSGNVWEEGIRKAITDGCHFHSETITGAMP